MYLSIFSHALDRHLAIGILRMPFGLDYSDKIANADVIPVENEKEKSKKGNEDDAEIFGCILF